MKNLGKTLTKEEQKSIKGSYVGGVGCDPVNGPEGAVCGVPQNSTPGMLHPTPIVYGICTSTDGGTNPFTGGTNPNVYRCI